MAAIDHISTILSDDAGVTAVASTRIFPLIAPQNAPRPCLAIVLVREADGLHLTGQNRFPLAEVLVDSIADSYGAANTLGDAVKAALIDFSGDIEGAAVSWVWQSGVDHFDRGDHGDLWRRRLGFEIRYRDVAPDDEEDEPEGP